MSTGGSEVPLATWIDAGVEEPSPIYPSARVFVRRFRLERPAATATLRMTALGLYVARIDGARVGEMRLRPGWTDHRARVSCQRYDVTAMLGAGEHELAVTLGDGWFSGKVAEPMRATLVGSRPSLACRLEISMTDGVQQLVESDTTWRWRDGPVRSQDLYDGEIYDARWEPGQAFARHLMEHPVRVAAAPLGVMIDDTDDGVRCIERIAPVAEPRSVERVLHDDRLLDAAFDRAWIFDFGQNLAGVTELRMRAPAGTTVVLRHGEMLDEHGRLYTANLRTANARDAYTFRGDEGGERWSPEFTIHGFRYVELSVDPNHSDDVVVAKDSLSVLALSSLTRDTGCFETSDPTLNRFWQNVRWSARSNFVEVPTDCPQRDERLGWTGDINVFAGTATFLGDVDGFLRRWLAAVRDAQHDDGTVPAIAPAIGQRDRDGGPGWSDATVEVAWRHWLAYADRSVLEEHYDSMLRWMRRQEATSRHGVRAWEGCGYYRGYSDWLALDELDSEAFRGWTPLELIGTAYLARSSATFGQIASILDAPADADWARELSAHAAAAFRREFVDRDASVASGTQTAYAMALAWDLLEPGMRAAAAGRLVDAVRSAGGRLTTGFLGTPLMCPVLTRFGHLDVAYELMMRREYPGWLYPVTQGATTIWERWNGWTPERGFADPEMNSFNHYAFGAVAQWLHETVGGIAPDPARPGYRNVVIAPRPGGGLTSSRCSLETSRGLVAVEWVIEDGAFRLDVRIPSGATGDLTMPSGDHHRLAPGRHRYEEAVTTSASS